MPDQREIARIATINFFNAPDVSKDEFCQWLWTLLDSAYEQGKADAQESKS